MVISAANFETTGSFTLTYATDVTSELTCGVPVNVNGTLQYGGQHADYTFTAVAGQPVTLAITNANVSPSGDSLLMQVYDSSGATDASGQYINTTPTEIDFTPTSAQAGPTTVVISAANFEATGSFTLTCATTASGTPPPPSTTPPPPSTAPPTSTAPPASTTPPPTTTAPPASTAPPTITGTHKAGTTLRCLAGGWTNNPTTYTPPVRPRLRAVR